MKKYEKFIEILKDEKYQTREYPAEYNVYFEQLNDYGNIAYLFDDLIKELGTIPTQTEYVEAGVQRAKEFFAEGEKYIYSLRTTHVFEWNEALKRSVESRLARTYSSYLIEAQVQVFFKSLNGVKVRSSEYLDLKFGADLVVNYEDKLYYLHIAKNSASSKRMLKEKRNRKAYILKDGKKYWWERDWKDAHHLLLFNDYPSDRMVEINGNLIFDEAWLKRYVLKLFKHGKCDVKDETSELHKFIEWLNANKLEFI